MISTLLKELESKTRKRHITRDQRLTVPTASPGLTVTRIDSAPSATWQSLLKTADVTWIIAPETDRALLDLTRAATAADKLYTGSSHDAVAITTSKRRTTALLHSANIDCVLTEPYPKIPETNAGWVAKRDDGVGCEDTHYFSDRALLKQHLEAVGRQEDWVIQPYLAGEALSLSLLCYAGDSPLVLACNQQIINSDGKGFHLKAIHINKYHDKRGEFQSLADQIAALLPGLAGFVGIDLIYHKNKVYVLEINPRFTTAYAALPQSLGINVAELILKTVRKKEVPARLSRPAKPVYLLL